MTQPQLQFPPDATLSVLVHAGAKIGKTTFSCSGPQPILAIDAEGSTKFIDLRKVHWNPHQGPPPRWDGTWDMCVVKVSTWQTFELVYQYLTQTPHDFRTVTLDSITELQRKLKSNLRGLEQMQMQDWGMLLVKMDMLIRNFRDLTLLTGSPVQCVVFVAETRENAKGKWVPYMQGQISISLPYWVDVCGYLFTQPATDTNGQADPGGKLDRMLWVAPHNQFEAGERVQGRLGSVVQNPKLTDMLCAVFGNDACQPSVYVDPREANGQAAPQEVGTVQ